MRTVLPQSDLQRRWFLGMAGALTTSLVAVGSSRATTVDERSDLQGVFAEHGTPGTFVLYDAGADKLIVVDRARAERRYTPASTFKIANAVIALETGAVRGENEVIPYGGKPQPFKQWERDMGMREAMALSAVPIYQEIARRVGPQRMQAMIDRLDYGNRRIGTVIDRFWLDGPLQISAVEQARFVARLARRQLPVSARSQTIVRDILRIERKGDIELYAKTGWLFDAKPQIGWWTGWVERGSRLHTFSLNIDVASDADLPKRLAIGRTLLTRLEVL
jgi:beta-lactamase class D